MSISSGDNQTIVLDKLLPDAKVLGSCNESTLETLTRITQPTSKVELLIRWIATHYATMMNAVHGKILKDLFSQVGAEVGAEEKMMDAFLYALRDLRERFEYKEERVKYAEHEASVPPISVTGQVDGPFVFLLRDFDALSDEQAERWLRWTQHVLQDKLAHVVLHTTSSITPSKVQWIQERHQRGLDVHNFAGILLRPANGVVDSTSAEEKLRDLTEVHGLVPFFNDKQDAVTPTSQPGGDALECRARRAEEVDCILKTTGNWWSDIDEICQRLKGKKLNNVKQADERLALIQDVCRNFAQETQAKLLKALDLDKSLQIARNSSVFGHPEFSFGGTPTVAPVKTNISTVISALDTWKCLESVAHVTPVTSANSLVNPPQQLLKQEDKTLLNCVSLVDALLPFNDREEGKQKFLNLIDTQILSLRPKNDVEIGVISCKSVELLSSCWVQMRPAVKKAFETIHGSDTYLQIILELDRFAANTEMQKEIELYALEIADRRKVLSDMTRHYERLQFSMTPAKIAQKKAELALINVELETKDVYLEKLRSLRSP